MLELESAMTYRLEVSAPLAAADGSDPDPRRQFWQMTRATLEGPRIRASSPIPGIDWFTPHHGRFGRPHVRLPFQTDDGAIVLLEYRGIVGWSAASKSSSKRAFTAIRLVFPSQLPSGLNAGLSA